PEPVFAELWTAQCRDRHDGAAGHHRLHDLPALFRVRPAERSPQGMKATIAKWDIFELALSGPSTGNPYVDVEFEATFTLGSRSLPAPGFYDGDGIYRVRFMPDAEGEWRYTTRSPVAELNGKTSTFICAQANAGAHGPVRVRNTFHFGYADGTPYFPFGTTC